MRLDAAVAFADADTEDFNGGSLTLTRAIAGGNIDRFAAPMAISKVAVADPKDGKPTRVGFQVQKDGKKVRVAKRSGELIDG